MIQFNVRNSILVIYDESNVRKQESYLIYIDPI